MAIQDLTASLDLKQNLNIFASCKQFDSLSLILSIYNNSLQADLSNYNVRLRAMKADKVPLIQEHIGITISTNPSNMVTIEADEQLTTTSGKTPIELQFIDKTTGKKKATFNLVLIVVPSTVNINGTISTATYTLLEELENKLDQASDFLENIDEAITANTNLENTITNSETAKTNLENTISTGDILETDLENDISIGNTLKTNLEESITNANNTKIALDQSKTDADTSKSELEAVVQEANQFVSDHPDASNLIETVAEHSTQLSDMKNLNVSRAGTTKSSRPMVGILDDDGNWDGIAWLKPIMDSHGWKFGVAMITGNIGVEPYATASELLNFQAEGNEIYSHTVNHAYTDVVSEEQYNIECRDSKIQLEALGIEVKGIVYPGGGLPEDSTQEITNKNIRLKRIISQYYDVGYTTRAWNVRTPIDPLAIDRIMIGAYMDNAVDTLANWKSYVLKAIRDKGWVVLCTHASGTSAEKKALLEEFFTWLATQDIDVVLPSVAYETFKSTYTQVGSNKFGVSEKGIHTKRGTLLETIIKEGYDEINASTQFTDWKYSNGANTLSSVHGTLAISQGLPEATSSGGYLLMLKWDTYEHCKRLWFPANSKSIYVQYSANGGNSWSTWSNLLTNKGDKNNFITGENNTISSGMDHSNISGGLNNSIQNHLSGVTNGQNNIITSALSQVGGDSNTASHGGSRIYGINGKTKCNYDDVWSGKMIDHQGDAQSSKHLLKYKTTDATPVVITLDATTASSSNVFVLPLNSAFHFKVSVVALGSDNNTGAWEAKGLIYRGSGSSVLKSATVEKIYADNLGWNVEVINSSSLNALAVRVTGVTGVTIKWVAKVELVEVEY